MGRLFFCRVYNSECLSHISQGMTNPQPIFDADDLKGATETDRPGTKAENSMNGELVHRGPDKPKDGADSDFPEPGSSPEHSGEHK